MVHPAIIPISNHRHAVVYLSFISHSCILGKKIGFYKGSECLLNAWMQSKGDCGELNWRHWQGPGTWHGDLFHLFWLSGFAAKSCSCAPNTLRSLGFLPSAQINTDIFTYCFFAEAGSLSPKKILKKIFPSTLRSYVVMWWNWLMSVESFSFEIGMPLALLQAVGISRFCHTTYICLHKKLRTSGTLL